MQQLTDTVLMIRPVSFRMNEQTAVNNYYQKAAEKLGNNLNRQAQEEFDAFVRQLQQAGIRVLVAEDTPQPETPDALFPNNWVSFHEDGAAVLYPMFAENRRLERREAILDFVEKEGFQLGRVADYTRAEKEGLFLEGTGSLVLDRRHQKAYCSLSPRASEVLLLKFCRDFAYTPVVFTARQTVNGKRLPIYHTNVVMALGEGFAVICLDCIDSGEERKNVEKHLRADGKELILLTESQVAHFAGNMLQVKNSSGKRYVVMSKAAYRIVTHEQRTALEKHGKLLHAPLYTIEQCGGGSARCMLAEVFLPRKLNA